MQASSTFFKTRQSEKNFENTVDLLLLARIDKNSRQFNR